jgi:GntR family transcriptional regulator, transcriptional repressor for pyruvate dehydrogenase complex
LSEQSYSSKVYLDVVESLRKIIDTAGLLPGDKIPSERELSERLNVGRSSVREALRALELLGLIETRRGEGTFIKDFQEHRLVELLGTFFLQNKKVNEDLAETKYFLEIDCLRLIISHSTDDELNQFMSWAKQTDFTDEDFFLKVAMCSPNRLLERIWRIVNSYAKASTFSNKKIAKETYLTLLTYLQKRDINQVIATYSRLIRKMSKSE